MTLAEAIKAMTLHLGVLESAGWGEAPLARALRVVLAELERRKDIHVAHDGGTVGQSWDVV